MDPRKQPTDRLINGRVREGRGGGGSKCIHMNSQITRRHRHNNEMENNLSTFRTIVAVHLSAFKNRRLLSFHPPNAYCIEHLLFTFSVLTIGSLVRDDDFFDNSKLLRIFNTRTPWPPRIEHFDKFGVGKCPRQSSIDLAAADMGRCTERYQSEK